MQLDGARNVVVKGPTTVMFEPSCASGYRRRQTIKTRRLLARGRQSSWLRRWNGNDEENSPGWKVWDELPANGAISAGSGAGGGAPLSYCARCESSLTRRVQRGVWRRRRCCLETGAGTGDTTAVPGEGTLQAQDLLLLISPECAMSAARACLQCSAWTELGCERQSHQ